MGGARAAEVDLYTKETRRRTQYLGLRIGFESPDLERPGMLPHQQGLCEARLGYQDESPADICHGSCTRKGTAHVTHP